MAGMRSVARISGLLIGGLACGCGGKEEPATRVISPISMPTERVQARPVAGAEGRRVVAEADRRKPELLAPADHDEPILDPEADFVPQRGWVAQPGDVASISTGDGKSAYVAVNMIYYRDMIKAWRAKDDVGLRELLSARKIALVENRTKVLVLETRYNDPYADGQPAVEVRLKGGEYADQVSYVRRADLEKLVDPASLRVPEPAPLPQPVYTAPQPAMRVVQPPKPAKKRAPEPKKKKSKPLADSSYIREASNAYRAARLIDTQGRAAEAVEAYRAFLKEYPAAEAAGVVKSRLKVLTGSEE